MQKKANVRQLQMQQPIILPYKKKNTQDVKWIRQQPPGLVPCWVYGYLLIKG